MSTPDMLRIGFIGAGAICRDRHLPGLATIAGVQVVAVANRTRVSGESIARQFQIPDVMDDWQALLARSDIDAVFIGTWPNMHRQMSVAALQAGKHVFCQARMAMDLAQARQMLAAARAQPRLVNMICPPPTRMPFEPFVRRVIANGELGSLISVELVSRSGANTKPNTVHWRERIELSGNQVMAMGIYAETLNAWVGPYETLMAQTSVAMSPKRDAEGREVEIRVPQVVTITGKLACGALLVEHHLGLVHDQTTRGDCLTIWGSKGTLRYGFGASIEMAAPGEALKPVNVPASERRDWWAEEEFITAVRAARAGQSWRVTPDFAEGLEYMRKVEAVHVSARGGRVVRLQEL